MEINRLYNENCLNTMAKMSDNFIDLVITSPPYECLIKVNKFAYYNYQLI